MIEHNQLIRYRTSTGRVAIRLDSTLTNAKLSLGKDSITINQLTLLHFPKQSAIYLGEQGFTLQALKESVQRSRQRRSLQGDKALASSGATSHKPWASVLFKQVPNLLSGVNWKWLTLLPAWRSTASAIQATPTLGSGSSRQLPKNPQIIHTVEEYTSGHLQGLLQLLDLGVRKWIGGRCSPLCAIPTNPLAEIEARLQAAIGISHFQQRCVSFLSSADLAADPYRGHSIDSVLTWGLPTQSTDSTTGPPQAWGIQGAPMPGAYHQQTSQPIITSELIG
ncbi:hypothetical protein [unidentified bacterial endosymbiont]|uniref:hypothetical protein n=1 Tax=unidentified bacterial endosymbiont TaxID=2355 RepID=UPI00209E420B|nr:hypothetical protein [unidentified bacterial endosymbiont]